jgi:hypothetical protein
MDDNLGELEDRAGGGVQRYSKIAAAVVAVGVVAAAGYLIWRKTRRPSLGDRLDRLSPESLRDLADEVVARLKKPLPRVKVTVNGKDEGPSLVESVLRKVTPAVVGTVAAGLAERAARPPRTETG